MRKRFSTLQLLPLVAALAATGALAATPSASIGRANLLATSGSTATMTAAAPTATNTTSTTTTGTTTGGTTTGGATTSSSALNATSVITVQPTSPSRTASGATTTEQTSGTSQAGTSTGDAFSGSSRGGAPAVGQAAVDALTNTGDVVNNPTNVFNGPTGIPIVVDNGAVANGAVTLNGERIAANPAAAIAAVDLGYAGSAVVPQAGTATSNATITADPSVRKELRKRQSLPRNGQLLYSIAPRTNANLGWQLKDDPVSPALRPPA